MYIAVLGGAVLFYEIAVLGEAVFMNITVIRQAVLFY
jgi:hypothetical protein